MTVATATTTLSFTNWLGQPVELAAVKYVGSLTDQHGTWALVGPCDEHDRGDCDGSTLIHPTSGQVLHHVRDQSWVLL
jgi:hypothetical protein